MIFKRFQGLFSDSKPPQYDLVVFGIFKNEASGIREWIQHYLREGVDHFLLIDNGSNDGSIEKIQSYIAGGKVTVFYDDTRWRQKKLYNKHFLSRRRLSEWIIVCDLDEFIYARAGYSTIKSYLQSLDDGIGAVKIPWKMFGSNGHMEQPVSVLQSFTSRSDYHGKINPGMDDKEYSLCKTIVRGRFLKKIQIHGHKASTSAIVIDGTGSRIDSSKAAFVTQSEEIIEKSYLHLNHYPLQSKKWFLSVKATRGSASSQKGNKLRNLEYFESYDALMNEVKDTELANKRY